MNLKILIDHQGRFQLAHGGFQIQIEQTITALRSLGIDAEYLRWFDAAQTAPLIHYFGRPNPQMILRAHARGIRYVMSDLLTGPGSRPLWRIRLHGVAKRILRATLPASTNARFRWQSYGLADACIALTGWEARLMHVMFGVPQEKLHVIPNGVEEVFFKPPGENPARSDYLVCTATITNRKRVVELAEAAVTAKVPVWIVGKPYSEDDPYYLRFREIHRRHPDLIRHEGPIEDRARLAQVYADARGFVLLSAMESQSLSALEAAAAGCPLLLSDLPWARHSFGSEATYCSINSSKESTADALRRFYDQTPVPPQPPRPKTWKEIALQLAGIYETVLVDTARS